MASPMIPIPKHLLMPVDRFGRGPCAPQDKFGVACWCGDKSCPGPTPENEHEEVGEAND